jgi:hypothetical protein
MTTLDPQTRGDTFARRVPITMGGSAYSPESLTGGIKFTLRTSIPDSSEVTDTGAIDQASIATGEIAIDGTAIVITIPASRTTAWPTGRLYYDLQGVISGSPATVYTLASGQIMIKADITRST